MVFFPTPGQELAEEDLEAHVQGEAKGLIAVAAAAGVDLPQQEQERIQAVEGALIQLDTDVSHASLLSPDTG